MRRILFALLAALVVVVGGCRNQSPESGVLDTSEPWDPTALVLSRTKLALCHNEGNGVGHVISVSMSEARVHLLEHGDKLDPSDKALRVGEPCSCEDVPRKTYNAPPRIKTSCDEQSLDDDGPEVTMPSFSGSGASCTAPSVDTPPAYPVCLWKCTETAHGSMYEPRMLKCFDVWGNCNSYMVIDQTLQFDCMIFIEYDSQGHVVGAHEQCN